MTHDLDTIRADVPDDRSSGDHVRDEDCAAALELLDERVGGALDPRLETRLELHLAGCPSCRRAEMELHELLSATSELPREVLPPRDLWPGVAQRLAPRREPVRRFKPAAGRLRSWGVQALAALLMMSMGGVLTYFFLPPRPAPADSGAAAQAAISAPMSDAAQPQTLREVASAVAPAAVRETWSAELASAEAEVMRAKEMLWVSALVSRETADGSGDAAVAAAGTAVVVAHNLRIIDQAISELRVALEADPGNPQLAQLLLASHRRSIELLERLARPPLNV